MASTVDGNKVKVGKRWSGSEWADLTKDVLLIGTGGIGSWLTMSLSRIEHRLTIVDNDTVDQTNVTGGQLFKKSDINKKKVNAIQNVCQDMGCTNEITPIDELYTKEMGSNPITITGLDNMKARKEVFEAWYADNKGNPDAILLDGRLSLETVEILAIRGDNEEQIKQYQENYLFSDEEASILDCTAKQTTFGAMNIASLMTATLCNFLTNRKLGVEIREVPFYLRMYLPLLEVTKTII